MLKICVILIVSVIHLEPLLLVREKERKKYFRFSTYLKRSSKPLRKNCRYSSYSVLMRDKNDFEYEQFLRSELLDKYNKGKKVSKERDKGI